jgi:hypothetical protein
MNAKCLESVVKVQLLNFLKSIGVFPSVCRSDGMFTSVFDIIDPEPSFANFKEMM